VAADAPPQINHHGIAFLLISRLIVRQDFTHAFAPGQCAQSANFQHFKPPKGTLVFSATFSGTTYFSFFHFSTFPFYQLFTVDSPFTFSNL
jgi:hypothetical protein